MGVGAGKDDSSLNPSRSTNMNFSLPTISGMKRIAASMLAVFTLAAIAPLALGGGTAQALTVRSVSGQATVTALCAYGGEPIIAMGNGDTIDGIIEISSNPQSMDAAAYLP